MMTIVKRLLSKAAALAILAGVTLAVYALVAVPAHDGLSELRTKITEQRELLGRFIAATGENGQMDEAEARSKASAGSAIFLPGTSDAVRVAELQALANTVVESEGSEIKTTRTLPVRERDELRLLGIEVQLTATIDQLQRILHSLETNRPYVVVDKLEISAPEPLPDDRPAGDTALQVRVSLLGVTRKG